MIRLTLFFALASALATLSCTSLSRRSDRDPASIAEACASEAVSVDPAQLSSQILFQLQEKERSAHGADLLSVYDEQFQHVQLMVTKSRVYSVGLSDEADPRLLIAKKALELIRSDSKLVSSSQVWNDRLFALDPALRPNPSETQIQAKASALIRKNRTPEARRLLASLSETSEAPLELRLAARLDLLRTYRFQGSDDEFLKQLELNKKWYAKTFSSRAPNAAAAKAYSSFFQALIRGHVKKENFDLAETEISALRKFHLAHDLSPADVDWMRGHLQELRGESDAAKSSYELALRELPVNGVTNDVTKDQLSWQLGWLNYKTRNFSRALELWKDLSTTGAAQVLARNLYWAGRAEKGLGHWAKADEISHQVLSLYPGTFYAPLASRDLGEKIRPLAPEKNECVLAGRVIARLKRKYPADDVAAFTNAYHHHDLARAKQVLMELSLSEGLDSSLYLAAAVMGDYQPLILGFQKLSLGEQRELFEQFPQLIYPNPYPELIASAAKENGLDPLFPLSTIRQESVFAPYAVSFADARGLMQVMPQLGEVYAKSLGLESYSKERLFEPGVNIPIGTRHLKEGFEAHRDSYILTLAAYNAGDEIAAVWERHLSKDPLELIEDIPFSETNGYVKAILRNEIYNHALYGDGHAFAFPENLLKR